MVEWILLLPDYIITIGIIGLIAADLKQLAKTVKLRDVTGLSETHYRLRLFSLVCFIIGYIISRLWLTVGVSIAQLSLVLVMLWMVKRYKPKKEPLKLLYDEQKFTITKDNNYYLMKEVCFGKNKKH